MTIRTTRKILVSFLLVLCVMSVIGSKPAQSEIVPTDLPEIVIAYALFCSRYAEFKQLQSNLENVLMKLHGSIEKMEKSHELLLINFSTRLAFGHRSFVVQTNIPGHISGLVRETKKTSQEIVIPADGMLYVTTPVEAFRNRSLVFLSSGGPERTTILAVDSLLGVELLYDSAERNKLIIPGIGRIDSIHVKAPGVLSLVEKTARDVPVQGPPQNGRSFLVDVTSGKFNISRQQLGRTKTP
jgi:hypothetical protein